MWDVVNESLASDGTLVENVFYRKLGPTYIEDCFRWAHEADPTAFLIYNDNKVEGCGEGYDSDGHKKDEDGNNATTNSKNVITTKDDDDDDDDDATKRSKSPAPNQAKSDGFYNLLKSLVDKGVPIHGAGMQAHFNAGGIGAQRPPTPAMVKRQIARIGKLGLKVNISELDVRVSKLPAVAVAASEETDSGNASKCNGNNDANKDIRTIAQTQIYRDILSAALSEPAFDGIWLWGFTDRHTWVKNFYYDDAPLIFDENYNKKSSYYGVQEALKTLCPGGKVGELMGGEKGQCFLTSDINEEGSRWGHEWMQPEHEDNDGKKDTTKEGQPDWMQPS